MKKINALVLFLLIASLVSCQKDVSQIEHVFESKLMDLQKEYGIRYEKVGEIPDSSKAISIEELKRNLDKWKDFKSEIYFGTVALSSRASDTPVQISWDGFRRIMTLYIQKCYIPDKFPIAISVQAEVNLDGLSMNTSVWVNADERGESLPPSEYQHVACNAWSSGEVWNISPNYGILYGFRQFIVINYYVQENDYIYRVDNIAKLVGSLIAGESAQVRLEAGEYYRTEV